MLVAVAPLSALDKPNDPGRLARSCTLLTEGAGVDIVGCGAELGSGVLVVGVNELGVMLLA